MISDECDFNIQWKNQVNPSDWILLLPTWGCQFKFPMDGPLGCFAWGTLTAH